MPFYYELKRLGASKRTRAVKGLQRLRKQLDEEMPGKTRSRTLILGTFNIRNFDDNRFGNGTRTTEDLMYLAEIISRFDVVAVQEVCRDLDPLKRIMRMLGEEQYDFIISDPTEGRSGNDERLGFIYDKSKVWFQGIAGELVLPDNMQIVADEKKRQFSRTPFMCSFQSGWFKFLFSTVHIYFGSSSGAKFQRRVDEIDKVAGFLSKRAKKDQRNHILVGDFNIVKPGSRGFNALEKHGFKVFQNKLGSNKDQTKFYDQISFLVRDGELRPRPGKKARGVFQFFDSIYRPRDFPAYEADLRATVRDKIKALERKLEAAKRSLARATKESSKAKAKKKIETLKGNIAEWKAHLAKTDAGRKLLKKYYTSEWRTFRASDHLPLWIELEIDFSGEYLEAML